ncbi:hypothetical protein [Pseudomonas corrugata]
MSEVERYWANGDGYLFVCGRDWLPKDDEFVLWPDFKRVQDERDAVQQRLNAADQRIDELTVPPALTDELRWILGQMCFQHIHTAQALRLMGHEIARKAEDEQAVTIYWMLCHYLKDPENWRKNAAAEMKAAAPTA